MTPKVKLLLFTINAALAVALSSIGNVTAQQLTYQARSVRPVSISGDLLDLLKANDERPDTRANSSDPNYAGQSVTIDIGSVQNVAGVSQDHGRWPIHYPGAYKVEVAASPSGPWMKTFEGQGSRGVSRAVFEAVRARYIRITATATNSNGEDW